MVSLSVRLEAISDGVLLTINNKIRIVPLPTRFHDMKW
jgi:hypothetical protein